MNAIRDDATMGERPFCAGTGPLAVGREQSVAPLAMILPNEQLGCLKTGIRLSIQHAVIHRSRRLRNGSRAWRGWQVVFDQTYKDLKQAQKLVTHLRYASTITVD
jgi:hypothetical protein